MNAMKQMSQPIVPKQTHSSGHHHVSFALHFFSKLKKKTLVEDEVDRRTTRKSVGEYYSVEVLPFQQRISPLSALVLANMSDLIILHLILVSAA